jgi:hypothetical protein
MRNAQCLSGIEAFVHGSLALRGRWVIQVLGKPTTVAVSEPPLVATAPLTRTLQNKYVPVRRNTPCSYGIEGSFVDRSLLGRAEAVQIFGKPTIGARSTCAGALASVTVRLTAW